MRHSVSFTVEPTENLRGHAPAQERSARARIARDREQRDAAFLQLEVDRVLISGQQEGGKPGQIRLVADEGHRGAVPHPEQDVEGPAGRSARLEIHAALWHGPGDLVVKNLGGLPCPRVRAREHDLHLADDSAKPPSCLPEAGDAPCRERPLVVVRPANDVAAVRDRMADEVDVHRVSAGEPLQPP
jgi:hypothetical protein